MDTIVSAPKSVTVVVRTRAPTLSTTAGKYDYVGFMYDSGSSKWNCLRYTIGLTCEGVRRG